MAQSRMSDDQLYEMFKKHIANGQWLSAHYYFNQMSVKFRSLNAYDLHGMRLTYLSNLTQATNRKVSVEPELIDIYNEISNPRFHLVCAVKQIAYIFEEYLLQDKAYKALFENNQLNTLFYSEYTSGINPYIPNAAAASILTNIGEIINGIKESIKSIKALGQLDTNLIVDKYLVKIDEILAVATNALLNLDENPLVKAQATNNAFVQPALFVLQQPDPTAPADEMTNNLNTQPQPSAPPPSYAEYLRTNLPMTQPASSQISVVMDPDISDEQLQQLIAYHLFEAQKHAQIYQQLLQVQQLRVSASSPASPLQVSGVGMYAPLPGPRPDSQSYAPQPSLSYYGKGPDQK